MKLTLASSKTAYFCTLSFFLLFININQYSYAQQPLFSGVPVSNTGSNNSIGSANTSRNVATDRDGNIYVLYYTPTEIRIAKSTNGGESFQSSVLIANASGNEPELNVNENGIVLVAWVQDGNLLLSRSVDQAVTFESPEIIGSSQTNRIHMSSFGTNVYITDQSGSTLYSNDNNGLGSFNIISSGAFMVYADVLTDQNGVVYMPMDDPGLRLFQSTDRGNSLTETSLVPPGLVYFSSYALSDGPCGTFIFVGGGAFSPSETLGYRMNVLTGEMTEITLGANIISAEGRTLYADNKGTLIDGYLNVNGDLMMAVSSDQGNTFQTPIIIAQGDSHNISRNPVNESIIVVYQSNGQIFLSVYDDILKNIELEEPDPPLSLCENDSFDLSFTLTGVFSPNTLFTVTLSDEFGNFTNAVEIGSVTTDASGVITCTIPNNIPRGFQYRIQIESLANCIQSNSIILSIGEGDITGPTQVCIGDTIQLIGTGTSTLSNPWASLDETVATIDNEGRLTGLTEGVTEISYERTNGCTATVMINVYDLPVVNSNTFLQLCDDDSDGFNVFNLTDINESLSSDHLDEVITFYETEMEAEIGDNPISNAIAYTNQIQDTDIVWARIENVNGCYRTTSFEIIVNEQPMLIMDDVWTLCEGETVDIIADDGYDEYLWSTGETTQIITVDTPGNYDITVTNVYGDLRCEDTKTITVPLSNVATITNIETVDWTVSDNSITITVEGSGDYEYSLDGIFYQDSNQFNGLYVDEYTVYVRDKMGCGIATQVVYLLGYPRYFTPNGDGNHDTWQIVNGFTEVRNVIRIFDRYGKLIKQISPTGSGWDGTLNGQLMPTSDYWFVVERQNGINYTGHFTLKR